MQFRAEVGLYRRSETDTNYLPGDAVPMEFADEPETEQPTPAVNAWGEPIEQQTEETPAIDVETIMGTQQDAQPEQGEILSGPIEGEPQEKKRRGRKPKQPDLLAELLKRAQFGAMAATIHTLMYRAINTPEHPCPELQPEEAQIVITATDSYARKLIEANETVREFTPLAAFVLANLIPIAVRVQPIAVVTAPFWQRVGIALSKAGSWIWGLVSGRKSTENGTTAP